MCRASCRRAPSEPDLANLSLPARSMRFSLPGGEHSLTSLNKYRVWSIYYRKTLEYWNNILNVHKLEMALETKK